MTKHACPRCGAPGGGFICAYCGAAMAACGDDGAEMAALEQYHALLDASRSNADQCSRLITDGFVPANRKALIEAGLRCVARIDVDQPFDGCGEQWVKRLDAISTRLRVLAGDDALRAVGEFEGKASAWRVANAKETRIALGFFAILILALAAGGWWLVQRIWR